MITVAAAAVRKRLLRTRAPSRLIGAKMPPGASDPARKAKSANAPPMKMQRMARMKMPRVGSEAKVCTEVSTPERTRKVPRRLRLKARMARRMVQIFSASRFSMTIAEWRSAVQASHGISEAFSTGSQNQKPPQPSS